MHVGDRRSKEDGMVTSRLVNRRKNAPGGLELEVVRVCGLPLEDRRPRRRLARLAWHHAGRSGHRLWFSDLMTCRDEAGQKGAAGQSSRPVEISGSGRVSRGSKLSHVPRLSSVHD